MKNKLIIDRETLDHHVDQLPFKNGILLEIRELYDDFVIPEKRLEYWESQLKANNVTYFSFEISYDDTLFISTTVYYLLVDINSCNTLIDSQFSKIKDKELFHGAIIHFYDEFSSEYPDAKELITILIRHFMPYCEDVIAIYTDEN